MTRNKRVYLHIGLPKTGSTSLQRFMSANERVMAEQGYLYTKIGRGPRFKHDNLSAQVRLSKQNKFDPNLGGWNDVVENALASPTENIVISCENFSMRDCSIESISSYLEPFDVRVIVYVKRQDLMLQSKYASAVATGVVVSDFHSFTMKELSKNNSDYLEILFPWEQDFGERSIIIRPFETQQLFQQDLLRDFLHCLNYPELSQETLDFSSGFNPRRGAKTLEVIRFFRSMLPDFDRETFRKRFSIPILRYAQTNLWDEQRSRLLDQVLAEHILTHYEASNAAFARKYLGRKDGQLFYEPVVTQEPTTFSFDEVSTEEWIGLMVLLAQGLCDVDIKTLRKALRKGGFLTTLFSRENRQIAK